MVEKYNTLLGEQEVLHVQKKSKFICNIKAIASEQEALDYIQDIKKKHYDARHHCYAYSIGIDVQPLDRFSDDGEPSGTAGKPITEVLKGAGLKNVVAVVTRYFGGVLLGTGGLIKAYTDSTKHCLEQAQIIEKRLCEKITVEIEYSYLPKLEYEIHKEKQLIMETIYLDNVKLVLAINQDRADIVKANLQEWTNGQIKIVSEGYFFV